MKTELIVKGQSWKSRIYILIYVAAMILMIKLIIGVVGMNEVSHNEVNEDKTEITKSK